MESPTLHRGGLIMAQRLLEKEVKDILQCIYKKQNFILEGGAGSGKTYSLISLINEIKDKNPDIRIVCITYTNNAVAEILSRTEKENLIVSTIHEFIWNLIRKYQKEIKEVLVELINDEESKFIKPNDIEDALTISYFKELFVDYGEYYSMTPNIENRVVISHDHIIRVAERLFSKYTKISDILKDIADCIFVDEYQDTSPYVTEILLKHLTKSKKENVIGFFGDSMQSIYDDSVGNLDQYNLVKIVKRQNRRNPMSIIAAANKFRDDELQQIPSEDVYAPNMINGIVKEGSIKFLYESEKRDFESIKSLKIFDSWDFSDGEKTKELRLTHKYNADMAGFKNLYELYNDDLILKLIEKIKKKIDKSDFSESDALDSLVISLNPKYNKENLRDNIVQSQAYGTLYSELKDRSWKDVYSRCRVKKDSLMAYKLNASKGKYESNSQRDRILLRLDSLYELIELYKARRVNDFLKLTKFKLENIESKVQLKETMDALIDVKKGKTIGEVMSYAEERGLLKNDELFENFIQNQGYYLWSRIQNIEFKEYEESILYLKAYSPICTQHSVKGSEYDNVLLVLESGWNKYDYNTLFGKGSKNEAVRTRTQNLFYVCITRAKENLVIYMPTNDSEIVTSAKCIFGEENVINIDSLD